MPWAMRRDRKWHVLIINDSNEARYNVSVHGEQVTRPWEWEVFEAHETKEIRVMHGDDASREIDITWDDSAAAGSPRRHWRGLPA